MSNIQIFLQMINDKNLYSHPLPVKINEKCKTNRIKRLKVNDKVNQIK